VYQAALFALTLVGLAATVSARDAPPAAAAAPREPAAAGSRGGDAATLTDPMSSLAGSQDAWSVSNTDAGCYLMSPRRTDSSRLAIGRHPKLGAGQQF
jgi:hypothetical protein